MSITKKSKREKETTSSGGGGLLVSSFFEGTLLPGTEASRARASFCTIHIASSSRTVTAVKGSIAPPTDGKGRDLGSMSRIFYKTRTGWTQRRSFNISRAFATEQSGPLVDTTGLDSCKGGITSPCGRLYGPLRCQLGKGLKRPLGPRNCHGLQIGGFRISRKHRETQQR